MNLTGLTVKDNCYVWVKRWFSVPFLCLWVVGMKCCALHLALCMKLLWQRCEFIESRGYVRDWERTPALSSNAAVVSVHSWTQPQLMFEQENNSSQNVKVGQGGTYVSPHSHLICFDPAVEEYIVALVDYLSSFSWVSFLVEETWFVWLKGYLYFGSVGYFDFHLTLCVICYFCAGNFPFMWHQSLVQHFLIF